MDAPLPKASPHVGYADVPEEKTPAEIRTVRRTERKSATWKAVGAAIATLVGSGGAGIGISKIRGEDDTRDKVIRTETKLDGATEDIAELKKETVGMKRTMHRVMRSQKLDSAKMDTVLEALKVPKNRRPTEADLDEADPPGNDQ